MNRRELITLLGGAAAASISWPLVVGAQQPERMRRIGVLTPFLADDPEAQARVAAFVQGLQQLGWTDGRNVRIDVRSGAGDAERLGRYAAELVALAPDVILAAGGTTVGPLLQATRTVPIVFTLTPDPVGAGFVDSLSRPGRNATGFTNFEYGIGVKWLELLKEIAPGVSRAAVLRDPAIPAGIGQLGAIQGVAPSFGIDLRPLDVRDALEIERAVTAFASSSLTSEASGQRGNSNVRAHSASEDARKRADDTRPEPGSTARASNAGLIVTSNASALVHRNLIIALAARHRLPAVYPFRVFVTAGGLVSYGPDTIDPHRRAAGYVDRILKGDKPGDLPVQAPVKFELAVNLKTARGLGLTVPNTLLATANEVIE
jgi:putative ABC transport system substrate-binding protein